MWTDRKSFNRQWFLAFFLIFTVFLNCETDENQQHNFQSIELLIDRPQEPLRTFQIDSQGRVAELIKRENEFSVLMFHLNSEELDSVKNSIKELLDFKYKDDPNSGCSHALFYDMSISMGGEKSYDFFNVICEEYQKPDELISYILETANLKKKDTLFKKYEEHAKTRLEVDSILNMKESR